MYVKVYQYSERGQINATNDCNTSSIKDYRTKYISTGMAIGLRTPILNRSISLCDVNVQTLAYFCNSFFRVGGIAANVRGVYEEGAFKARLLVTYAQK